MGIVTWQMCKNLDENGLEYFAFLFGTWTGTISTGLVLLRMVDPESKSPVPLMFGVGNSLAMPGVVMITMIAYGEVVYKQPLWMIIGLYALCAVVFFGLMKFVKIPASRKGWDG